MVDAFAAGGLIADTVVAADGTLCAASMGGNAVYAAAGMRLWLPRVGIVATVPRNYPADWLHALAAAGIDTSGLHVVDEDVDGCEWFFYRADGSRTDGLHAPADAAARLGHGPGRLSPAATARLEASLREAPAPGRSFGAFRQRHPVRPEHVPAAFRRGSGAHLGTNRPDACLALAAALRRPGFRLTLDPGGRAAEMLPLLPRLLPLLDAILPSEAELAVLAPGRPGAAGLAHLLDAGAAMAAVKQGSRGALLSNGARVPALPVAVRDPTGAGDAWCGGFLAGWLRTGDVVAAACCGAVSASFAVEAFGPLHLLRTGPTEARARLGRLMTLLPPGLVPGALRHLEPGCPTP